MSTRSTGHADDAAFIAGILVAGILGVIVLDRAPWVLPWALAGVLLVPISSWVALRRRRVIRRRTVWRPAAAGLIMAVIVWGGSGVAIGRDIRRQLRARPPAAVAAYVRAHVPHVHPRTAGQQRLARRRRRAFLQSPSARLYGVGQLGDWHWQRLIAGYAALLGGPLALWGIATGLGLARRRQRRPGPTQTPGTSLAQHGQAQLRTAGRGR